MQIWDSSNIAESYSGIVLPLTCSFAQSVYTQVYKDVARTSGVSAKVIEKNSAMFGNLLGFFYGRFYYNVINWHQMLALFPGYKRNKHNLSQMISAKEQMDDTLITNKPTLWLQITYYPHTLYRYVMFHKTIAQFKKRVRGALKYFSKQSYESKSKDELLVVYEKMQKSLLKEWSITVDNDFLAMTFYGKLQKRIGDDLLSESLSQMKEVVSAKQISILQDLAKLYHSHADLENLSAKDSLAKIKKDHPQLQEKIEAYQDKFGSRFASELRLEADDLNSHPEYIIDLMNAYKDAKKIAKEEVRDLKGKVNNYLLRRTKHFLWQREELRLLRSNAFSQVRRLFLTLGQNMQKRGVLANQEDIFYLTVEEIHGDESKVREIVEKRKKEYEQYKEKKPKTHFTLREQEKIPLEEQAPNGLGKAKGCSKGSARGKVTVMNSFSLKGAPFEIVVVKNTDPGWTPLFGLCKGLIVEQGGLLSHAAIVSREIGLPCVIGASKATSILKNGMTVSIDGKSGSIEIH